MNKSARTIRREIQVKALARIVQAAHPDLGWRSDKVDGVLSSGTSPLVRVRVGVSQKDPTTLECDCNSVSTLSIHYSLLIRRRSGGFSTRIAPWNYGARVAGAEPLS